MIDNKKIKAFRFIYLIFLYLPGNIAAILTNLPTYSQHDYRGAPLDHLLIELMRFKQQGIFIEVGAYNGVLFSNTKLLEDHYGWTGILIEPSLKRFYELLKNRPNAKNFCCALGSFDEHGSYGVGDFDGGLMASLTDRTDNDIRVKVPIYSLQSILDQCGFKHIDFFSLDTEGYELNILKGIDFKRTTFDYLLIEIYTGQYNEICNFLDNEGYQMILCLSNYNRISNPGWDGRITITFS